MIFLSQKYHFQIAIIRFNLAIELSITNRCWVETCSFCWACYHVCWAGVTVLVNTICPSFIRTISTLIDTVADLIYSNAFKIISLGWLWEIVITKHLVWKTFWFRMTDRCVWLVDDKVTWTRTNVIFMTAEALDNLFGIKLVVICIATKLITWWIATCILCLSCFWLLDQVEWSETNISCSIIWINLKKGWKWRSWNSNFKGSNPRHFIFEINVGNRRSRQTTTPKLNF